MEILIDYLAMGLYNKAICFNSFKTYQKDYKILDGLKSSFWGVSKIDSKKFNLELGIYADGKELEILIYPNYN